MSLKFWLSTWTGMAREVPALSALAEAMGEGVAGGAGDRAQAAARRSRVAVKETWDVRMTSAF
jgi:hypothetical protein